MTSTSRSASFCRKWVGAECLITVMTLTWISQEYHIGVGSGWFPTRRSDWWTRMQLSFSSMGDVVWLSGFVRYKWEERVLCVLWEPQQSLKHLDALLIHSMSALILSPPTLSLHLAPWLPNSVHLHSLPQLAEIVSSSCGALGCNQITATEMEWTTNYPAVYVCSFWANVLTKIQRPVGG